MPALFFCVILDAITTVPLMLRPTVWMLLAILLFVACDNGERQRLQLAELERQNRADSLMLNDSLVRDLADWFDRHGTPNEQMRAHYILGRTYADRGESPAALDAYNDAADRADTTAQDCDYNTLCRVYAQEADLFFQQNLLDNYLSALDKSVRYAWEAKDTMMALNEKTHKIIAYDLLQRNDSVILLFNQAFEELCRFAGEEIASQYCMYPVNALLMEKLFPEAKRYMDIYQEKSGFFDSLQNIEAGREIYYYYRGQYYLSIHHYDSAYYYFNKGLRFGKSYECQNASALGLAKLYRQTHQPDSSARYALYAYEMNDSMYSEMSTEIVSRMHALHDYSRHLRIAQQQTEIAERERQRFWSFVFVIVCIFISMAILAGIIFSIYRQKRISALRKYLTKVEELKTAKNILSQYKQQNIESSRLISEKEQEIQVLETELERYVKNQQLSRDNDLFLMEECGIGQLLRKKAAIGTTLNHDEWERINLFIREQLPGFDEFISKQTDIYGTAKGKICVLLRLYVGVKNTGTMLGVSSAYVSKMSREILSELFKKSGSGKELTKELSKFR